MNLTKLDKVFSLYIRLKNADENGLYKCFACGKILHYKEMDCSHFINRRFYALRFNEINCQVTCRYCNRFCEGNLAEFGINLQRKYGDQIIKKLVSMKHNYIKWTQFDIDTLEIYYKEKVKELLLNKGIK